MSRIADSMCSSYMSSLDGSRVESVRYIVFAWCCGTRLWRHVEAWTVFRAARRNGFIIVLPKIACNIWFSLFLSLSLSLSLSRSVFLALPVIVFLSSLHAAQGHTGRSKLRCQTLNIQGLHNTLTVLYPAGLDSMIDFLDKHAMTPRD